MRGKVRAEVAIFGFFGAKMKLLERKSATFRQFSPKNACPEGRYLLK
jgi:hypothetical protein